MNLPVEGQINSKDFQLEEIIKKQALLFAKFITIKEQKNPPVNQQKGRIPIFSIIINISRKLPEVLNYSVWPKFYKIQE